MLLSSSEEEEGGAEEEEAERAKKQRKENAPFFFFFFVARHYIRLPLCSSAPCNAVSYPWFRSFSRMVSCFSQRVVQILQAGCLDSGSSLGGGTCWTFCYTRQAPADGRMLHVALPTRGGEVSQN